MVSYNLDILCHLPPPAFAKKLAGQALRHFGYSWRGAGAVYLARGK